MKKNWIIFALLIPLQAWSQVAPFMHFMFQTPLPMGEFKEVSDQSVVLGARFQLYLRLKPTSPLQVGLDLGIFDRGHAKETLRLNVAGFEDDYEVNASNGSGNFGVLLKLEPWASRRVSPYLEGEAGSNVFYSHVYFSRKQNSTGEQTLENDATKGRWTFFFGGSAGLKIAFDKKRSSGIDLKCAYLKGSKTSYNAKPEFTSQGAVLLRPLRSTTDLLVPQIGLWIDLRTTAMTHSKNRAERRI